MSATGYLDHVDDRALMGWVLDVERAGALQTVICHVGDATIPFRSTFGREDVSAMASVLGRFGFAIPIEPLRALGPTVTLTDAHGNVLAGARDVPLPPRRPGSAPGRARTWVFVHIQKTAGTSLRLAITEGRSREEWVLIYPDGFSGLLVSELAELPWSQRAALRMVAGHAYFGVHAALVHPADYITVLRRPETRLPSHYRHHQVAGSLLERDGVPLRLEDAVSNGSSEEFDNLMVRMVTGLGAADLPIGAVTEETVELAVQTVRRHYRFVGLLEHLDRQMPALCSMLGLPPRTLDVVNRGERPDAASDAVDWSAALHHNRFDAMLYDRLVEEGLCGRDLALPP